MQFKERLSGCYDFKSHTSRLEIMNLEDGNTRRQAYEDQREGQGGRVEGRMERALEAGMTG